jgi:hypothetical protein
LRLKLHWKLQMAQERTDLQKRNLVRERFLNGTDSKRCQLALPKSKQGFLWSVSTLLQASCGMVT